jgi:hypothetical protein
VRDDALIYDAERRETLEAPAKTLAEPRESPTAATEQPGRVRTAGAGRRGTGGRRVGIVVA